MDMEPLVCLPMRPMFHSMTEVKDWSILEAERPNLLLASAFGQHQRLVQGGSVGAVNRHGGIT